MDTDQLLDVLKDISSNGETLTKNEACKALCACKKNPQGVQLADAFLNEDGDMKDTISFEEFEMLYRNVPDQTVEDLEYAFQTFDKNGDGTIDKEELKKILKFACEIEEINYEELTDADIDEILNKIDTNEDGALSYRELAEYLLESKTLLPQS